MTFALAGKSQIIAYVYIMQEINAYTDLGIYYIFFSWKLQFVLQKLFLQMLGVTFAVAWALEKIGNCFRLKSGSQQ